MAKRTKMKPNKKIGKLIVGDTSIPCVKGGLYRIAPASIPVTMGAPSPGETT